jgi:positive regulator of sigma E activity
MLADVLIMTYVLLMALLIFQAEKLSDNSVKVILMGLFLTPIVGYIMLAWYQKMNAIKS